MSFIDDGFDISEWNQDESFVEDRTDQLKRSKSRFDTTLINTGPSKTMQVIDLVSDSDNEHEILDPPSENDPEVCSF